MLEISNDVRRLNGNSGDSTFENIFRSKLILFRYIESEIVKESIEVTEDATIATPAPAPREITDLETNITTIEENLKEVSDNFVSLM